MAKSTGKDFLIKLKQFVIDNEFCPDELAIDEFGNACSPLPRKSDGQDKTPKAVSFSLDGSFYCLEETNRDKDAIDEARSFMYYARHELDEGFIKAKTPDSTPEYHAYALYQYKIGMNFGKTGVIKAIDRAINLAENFNATYDVVKQKLAETKKTKVSEFIFPTKTIEKYSFNSYGGFISIKNKVMENKWDMSEANGGWLLKQMKDE